MSGFITFHQFVSGKPSDKPISIRPEAIATVEAHGEGNVGAKLVTVTGQHYATVEPPEHFTGAAPAPAPQEPASQGEDPGEAPGKDPGDD